MNKSENKNKPSILAALALLFSACLFLSLIGLAFVLLFRWPLAEPMKLAVKPTTIAAAQTKITPTPNSAPAAKPEETCGRSGVQYLLLVGADYSAGVWPLGADSVRLIKVDYGSKALTVVAFPRDLLVKTPGLADLNKQTERLGLAYFDKKEATKGEEQHRIAVATQLVAQTLLDNFQMPTPEHYLTLQLNSVAGMIDAIGGVEVTLPEEIVSDYHVKYPAGKQTLDGKLAMEYVRTWDPGGDPARLLRQNLFVKALRAKINSGDYLTKLPDLFKEYNAKKVLVTDLNLSQSGDLICMIGAVPDDRLVFHEIVGDMVVANPDGSFTPNVEKINANLQEWLKP